MDIQPPPSRVFEQVVLPHLDAAYNLARWMTRNGHDAEDVVQEAFVRALRFFGSFHGVNARAWLLAIVRNTCYTWLRQHRGSRLEVPYDDAVGSDEAAEPYPVDGDANPEALLAASEERQTFDAALDSLPAEFREAVILRDVEDLSYKEIAAVAAIPIGTVMSRLARGRRMLFAALTRIREGGSHGM